MSVRAEMWWLFAAIVAGAGTIAGIIWLVASVVTHSYAEARAPVATVARICRSGDTIFHYADGTNRTSWGYIITEPDLTKVCT